jgi:excisionase family DNA binding protein
LTAQGHPRVIFKRAIERGNLLVAELARALVIALRADPKLLEELRDLLMPDEAMASSSPFPPWLSLEDAAAYLHVSDRTLERRIASGRVRSTTLGRRRLLHRDDLDALARAATGEDVAPTTPSRRRGE